ncbi:unnamed protein product, partial [Rotaria sp. Silwood2]
TTTTTTTTTTETTTTTTTITTTTETTTTETTTTTTETTTTGTTTTTTETTTTTTETTTSRTTRTTTTSLTTTTTTTSITTVTIGITSTTSNYISLVLGLALGLGIPLLILIGVLISCYCCSCCLVPLKAILRVRYGDRTEQILQEKNKVFNRKITHRSENQDFHNTNHYQLQNINDVTVDSAHMPVPSNEKPPVVSLNDTNNDDHYSRFELDPWTVTTTSFLSPSFNNLPTDRVTERSAPPLVHPIVSQLHDSILVEAYHKQQQ